MKSAIILLTLSILLVFVQEISSASPRAIAPSRSNYGGTASNKYKHPSKQGEDYDDKQNAPFFPGNAMMLFELKTAITSSLHKIEDDEESLQRIQEEIKLLKGLVNALFSFFKDAVEGLMTHCVIFGGANLPYPIKMGNKCYTISDTNPILTPDATYEAARQKCLASGGDLATPPLLENSTFGVDLEEYFEQAKESGDITSGGTASNYWINGKGPTGGKIETSYGFVIPSTFKRSLSMSTPPYAPMTLTVDSGLTFVGPILANEVNWYIDVKPKTETHPYICQFGTVFDLQGFAKDIDSTLFRTVKSSLLQDFIRKVKLIHKKKLAARKPLVDAANLKTEEPKTEEVKTEVKTEEGRTEVKTEEGRTEVKTEELKTEAVKTEEFKTAEVKTEKFKTEKVIMKEPQDFKVTAKVDNEKKSSQPEPDLGTKATEVVKKVENTKADEMKIAATKKDELPETKKTLQKEEIKVIEELPKKENVEVVKEEEVVVEGAKDVNEKTLLLEDILGKLEQLESFRALRQPN